MSGSFGPPDGASGAVIANWGVIVHANTDGAPVPTVGASVSDLDGVRVGSPDGLGVSGTGVGLNVGLIAPAVGGLQGGFTQTEQSSPPKPFAHTHSQKMRHCHVPCPEPASRTGTSVQRVNSPGPGVDFGEHRTFARVQLERVDATGVVGSNS